MVPYSCGATDTDAQIRQTNFPEGEIDFVAAPPLTTKPAQEETLFDHRILVESSSEIIGKKVWQRGFEFTARDIFDLAMVAEREPQALGEISSILRVGAQSNAANVGQIRANREIGGSPPKIRGPRPMPATAVFGSLRRISHNTFGSLQMNPNQALWEKGDFTRIARTMRRSGEQLVGRLGITKGMNVLDLGCGDGTTAIPEAMLGADVLGVDIAANLVAAGNKRAAEAGLTNCKFQQGDASDLHELNENSFDLVVSIFGAMFAPKPFDVAKEMVRVCRSGGRIVMGNWIPNDPTLVAQILKISSAYSPPPPDGFVSPMTWGVEANVVERFSGAGIRRENIGLARETYTFEFPGSPSEFVDAFRNFYGPTMNAFAAAEGGGRAKELQAELEKLFISQNTSGGTGTTVIPATYLRVTVTLD